MKTYRAIEIGRYFLSLTDPEDNDVSNLKLQKLCYYAQGLMSALRGRPLFLETIEAWDHGPVVPALYHKYKGYGSQPLVESSYFDPSDINHVDREILGDIYSYYAQFSAWRLRDMTHQERPWIDAYKTNSRVISLESMVEYFKPQLSSGYAKEKLAKARSHQKVSQNVINPFAPTIENA